MKGGIKMEDRFLFRGFQGDDGEWIYGHYVFKPDISLPRLSLHFIVNYSSDSGLSSWTAINPLSLCQCTGLKDKNGKLIFEKDIIKLLDGTGHENKISRILFENLSWILSDIKDDDYYASYPFMHLGQFKGTGIEIIGNMYDNSELLK